MYRKFKDIYRIYNDVNQNKTVYIYLFNKIT